MHLSTGVVAVVEALGSMLLHFLWQGALVGLLYALLRPACASVTARYRLGLLALLALAACPPLTLAWLWPAADAASAAAAAPSLGETVMAVADRAVAQWPLREALPWLVAAWLFGVTVLAARSLWQWRRLRRLVRTATPVGPEWDARLDRLCRRFALRRPVRLLASAAALTPMLIGWLKPVVLLPASLLSGFTPQQVELIVAHELGHIRRADYLANLFQVVIETVLFYHPVVHWISREVRNARESCCDELVLSLARGDRLAYARTLADLEELRHADGVAAPALGASGGVLLARIRHIVGVAEEPLPRTQGWPLLLLVAALAMLAWRQHAAAPNTAPAAPAQALALISGNPRLAALPSAPSRAVPEARREAAPQTTTDVEREPVRIATPRIVVARTPRLEPLREVATRLPPPSGDLRLAEPVAETAPAEVAPVEKLAPLHRVPPVYPPRAMAAGVEGTVELEFGIAADGSVRDVRVLHAQPAGVFDAAAREALAQWRFAPGAATAVRHTQSFAFALRARGEEANAKCESVTGSMICRRLGE